MKLSALVTFWGPRHTMYSPTKLIGRQRKVRSNTKLCKIGTYTFYCVFEVESASTYI